MATPRRKSSARARKPTGSGEREPLGRKDFDRQQIARMYRVARVISHVATNGKVVIEADVPRRFIERLTTPVRQEQESHAD